MATFGYTTKCGTETSLGNNIRGSYFTGVSGTLASITAYYKQNGSYYPSIEHSLYTKTGNATGDLVTGASTPHWHLTYGWDNWKTLSPDTPPSISAGDYWILTNITNPSDAYIYYDDSATWNKAGYQSGGSWPASVSFTASQARLYSIYATYTASGGTTRTPRQGFINLSTMSVC
jgi:hypothetical protein